MISTITPATISILTTTAAAGLLEVIGIVTLALLLIQKELASPKEDHLGQRLSRVFNIGIVPLKTFMLRQTRESDLALFVKISNSEPLQSAEDVPLRILVPSYVISELKTAFQIGFVVFIPFLIIDMVVASVLMSMGMMMVSPAMISLPFKIMLFVLADGWNLLIGSLVHSFYT